MTFDRAQGPERECRAREKAGFDPKGISTFTKSRQLCDPVDEHREGRKPEDPPGGELLNARQNEEEKDARDQACVDCLAARADRHRHVPQLQTSARNAVTKRAE